MTFSICIASYGKVEWQRLALARAYPSAMIQDAYEIILEHQPDGDVATSRNAAAERASGEWLCFLDADDELGSGYIERMQHAARGVHGQYMLLLPRVSYIIAKRRRPPRFWKETSLQVGNWLVIGTCVQRELFGEVGGFEAFHHGLEDWALWSRCYQAGAKIKKVPGAIYIAHWNDDSAHRQLRKDRVAFWKEYERTRKAVWG